MRRNVERWLVVTIVVAGCSVASAAPQEIVCSESATQLADARVGKLAAGLVVAPGRKASAAVAIVDVPGLRPDGSLDFDFPLPTAVLAYRRIDAPVVFTWWFHEYGAPAGERRTVDADAYRRALRAELATLKLAAGWDRREAKRLADAQAFAKRLDSMVSTNQLAWDPAGTVVDVTAVAERHRTWIEADLDALAGTAPTLVMRDRQGHDHLHVADVAFEEARALAAGTVTMFSTPRFAITTDTTGTVRATLAASATIQTPPPDRRRLYVEGLRPSRDTYRALDQAQVDTLVRFSTSLQPLATIDRVLQVGQKLRRPRVVIGFPAKAAEVLAQGLAPTATLSWLSLAADVRTRVARRRLPTLGTKAALLRELASGSSDTIIIYAHADGRTLYLGAESISLAELEASQPRTAPLRRTIVLLSCLTGRDARGAPPMVDSFAQVLLAKGFATSVIAPPEVVLVRQLVHALDVIVDTPVRDLLRVLRRLGLPFEWFVYAGASRGGIA